MAAAVGGGFAGGHPTGVTAVDVIYSAAAAALITLAASRASRTSLLLLTAVGFAFSRSWMLVPAAAALILAFVSVFQKRAYRRLNALVGAVGSQVLLRWPHVGFQGMTAVIATVVALVVLVSGWRHCASRTRRVAARSAGALAGLALVFTIPVVLGALLARSHATHAISLAKGSLTTFEAGQTPAARTQLGAAASEMSSAHSDVAGFWSLGGYLVPGVAQQERALDRGTAAGARLTATAAREAARLDLSSLRYTGGQIDLSAVRGFQGPARTLDDSVRSTQVQLQQIRSPWLVSPLSDQLDRLATVLARARSSADLAVQGVDDAPALLGGDGVRHYFVAFMSPAETRGLGGFIGAYGELTVDQGKVSLTRSGRPGELSDGVDPKIQLVAPPSYLAHYGSFDPQYYFGDVTYAPDLPTVAQVIDNLYPQVGGDHLDGVLVLDPNALASLLRFTGPITVPGLDQPLTSANAADVLLRQQYLLGDVSNPQRHDLLQDALKAGFDKLTTGSLPSPKALSSALGPEVRQGRLLFYSNNPADQEFLGRLGLLGYFPSSDGGDLLATTVANGGNSKIDAYVHQTTSDAVSYDPVTGHVLSTLTISFQNTAPSQGLPRYVIGSFKDSGLPPGTSSLWLNVYTPLRVAGATLDGQPFSFADPVGEDGVSAYGGYVAIPSGSTVKLQVSLDGYVRPGPDYKMTLRLQPLANPQSVQVSAGPAGAGAPAGPGTEWTASADQVQQHTWVFRP